MLLEMNWNSKELMKLNLICPSSPVTIQQSLTPLSSHSLSAPKRNNKYWPVVQLMENTFPRTRTRTSGPVLRISMIGFGCLLQMHALSSGWRRVIGNICFFQFELKFLSHKFVPDTIAKFSADSPYPLDPRTHRIWTGIKFHLFYALCFIQFSILCFVCFNFNSFFMIPSHNRMNWPFNWQSHFSGFAEEENVQSGSGCDLGNWNWIEINTFPAKALKALRFVETENLIPWNENFPAFHGFIELRHNIFMQSSSSCINRS